MAAIETDILEAFYLKLGSVNEVTESMVENLRALLGSDGKLKPEDFVRIFAPPSEEQIP